MKFEEILPVIKEGKMAHYPNNDFHYLRMCKQRKILIWFRKDNNEFYCEFCGDQSCLRDDWEEYIEKHCEPFLDWQENRTSNKPKQGIEVYKTESNKQKSDHELKHEVKELKVIDVMKQHICCDESHVTLIIESYKKLGFELIKSENNDGEYEIIMVKYED